MGFSDRLEATAQDTARLLDRLLRRDHASAARLIEAMRYAALAPGKRLRPFLVCESAQILGVERSNALHAGAALECVHCYSLVHDDLPAMDDDDMRRGLPTCHVRFDEATAILAGDSLLTFAFEILSREATHNDPAVRIELVRELAIASGSDGMAGGQMLDLEAEQQTDQGLEDIIAIQSLKTGALFRFALKSGAILAKAPPEDHQVMETYASKIGLAFQIADDILDVESSLEQLGKATQKDARAGKATFIDLYGLKGARQKACDLVDEAVAAISRYGKAAGNLEQAARYIVERQK